MPKTGHDKAQYRRLKTLDYLRDYFARNNYGPTIAEIQQAMKISSTSVVSYQLDRLEEQGWLLRRRDLARGLQLVDPWGRPVGGAPQIPIIADLDRRQPLPNPDPEQDLLPPDWEQVNIPTDLYYRHKLLYALRLAADWPEALLSARDLLVCSRLPRNAKPEDGWTLLSWNPQPERLELGRLTKENGYWQIQPPHPQAPVQLIPPAKPSQAAHVALILRAIANGLAQTN